MYIASRRKFIDQLRTLDMEKATHYRDKQQPKKVIELNKAWKNPDIQKRKTTAQPKDETAGYRPVPEDVGNRKGKGQHE